MASTAGNTHTRYTVSPGSLGLLLVLANPMEKLQMIMIIVIITTTTDGSESFIMYMSQLCTDCNVSIGVH